MSDLKSVVVIGGSKGIGRAVALLAATEGAEVLVTGRDKQALDATFGSQPRIETADFDVKDPEAVEAVMSGRHFSHIAILAGSIRPGPLAELTAGQMAHVFQERVIAPAHIIKTVARSGALQSVVLTSGMSSIRPQKAAGALFSTALAGVEGLARGLAIELAPTRVNAVRLGWVKSERHNAVPGGRDAFYSSLESTIPVGHVGNVDSAASLFLHLMKNDYMNGQTVVCDGGSSGV